MGKCNPPPGMSITEPQLNDPEDVLENCQSCGRVFLREALAPCGCGCKQRICRWCSKIVDGVQWCISHADKEKRESALLDELEELKRREAHIISLLMMPGRELRAAAARRLEAAGVEVTRGA